MLRFAGSVAVALVIALVAGLAPGVSQEDESPREKYARLRQPGEMHKWLAQDAGDWSIAGKMFLGGERTVDLKGDSTVKMVLDRYAHEEYALGEGPGQYKGFGYLGYDNIAEEFRALYCGTSGTGMNILSGTLNKERTVLTLSGEWEDKFAKMTRKQRVVITRKGTDETLVQMFEAMGDHELEKVVELTYTRKK